MSQMLEVLARAEEALPKLLLDGPGWHSLDVNYHPPHVERLWRPFEGDYRLFLHCIHPCEPTEALLHPHPWPSAMRVLSGAYRMLVGSGPGLTPPPVVLDTFVNVQHNVMYRYVMDHPDGWHAVVPVGTQVFTVMITGKPWDRPIPKETTAVRGSLKPLDRMRAASLLTRFHCWYAED